MRRAARSGRAAASSAILVLALAWILAAVSSMAGAGAARAATHPALPDSGRFVLRSVSVEHTALRSTVWLPPGYDRRRAWPAILFLHGSGECGTDGVTPTQIGLGPALRAHPDLWPFVVIFPQKPVEDREWEECEAQVFASLADAVKKFHVDAKRVALVGVSQGGHGTWMIGARHPERWTCLVAVAGYGRARTVQRRAVHLPVWAFHGLRDDLVDPNDSRRIVAGLREQRAKLGLDPDAVHLTLFPEANHNSWDLAFAQDSLRVWLKEQLSVK